MTAGPCFHLAPAWRCSHSLAGLLDEDRTCPQLNQPPDTALIPHEPSGPTPNLQSSSPPEQFGYFLRNNNCTPHLAPPVKSGSGGAMRPSTPEIIKERTLWHVANALAWGAPMALPWQL